MSLERTTGQCNVREFELVTLIYRKKGAASMIEELLISLTVFVLAMFVGYSVITKVPPTLHTPLMSGSNAISGIVVVGALVIAVREGGTVGIVLGLLALILATINVVGGYMVTDRMLRMFRRSDEDRR